MVVGGSKQSIEAPLLPFVLAPLPQGALAGTWRGGRSRNPCEAGEGARTDATLKQSERDEATFGASHIHGLPANASYMACDPRSHASVRFWAESEAACGRKLADPYAQRHADTRKRHAILITIKATYPHLTARQGYGKLPIELDRSAHSRMLTLAPGPIRCTTASPPLLSATWPGVQASLHRRRVTGVRPTIERRVHRRAPDTVAAAIASATASTEALLPSAGLPAAGAEAPPAPPLSAPSSAPPPGSAGSAAAAWGASTARGGAVMEERTRSRLRTPVPPRCPHGP